jgi:cytochrome c oxidase assembly protein subunit 11
VNKRARLTTWIVSGAALSMLGLSFAAEPLYSTFCRLTGFGGTTQVATEAPEDTFSTARSASCSTPTSIRARR